MFLHHQRKTIKPILLNALFVLGAIYSAPSSFTIAAEVEEETAPAAEAKQVTAPAAEVEEETAPAAEAKEVTEPAAEAEEVAAPTDPVINELYLKLQARLPNLPISEIRETPYAGFYEVTFGARVIYVSSDAAFLFQGSMVDLNARVDLTQERQTVLQMQSINNMGEENMLVYTAKENKNRSITVFTDVDCGYCRRLHSEIDTLLENGVNVRYLMFPRAGIDSASYKTLESVWCADDPLEAMTAAKAGQPIEEKSCENPIFDHMELASDVGLRGTPLIYLDDGTMIPGYREATELVTLVQSTTPMEQ